MVEEHPSSGAKNLSASRSPVQVPGDPYLLIYLFVYEKKLLLLGTSPFQPFLPLVWGRGEKQLIREKVESGVVDAGPFLAEVAEGWEVPLGAD